MLRQSKASLLWGIFSTKATPVHRLVHLLFTKTKIDISEGLAEAGFEPTTFGL